MQGVATPPSTQILAASLFEQGASISKVSQALSISRSTASMLKHQDLVDPQLVQHVSQHLSNKHLLVSNAATDELLDKAMAGGLRGEKPIELAKIASIMAQSSVAYATVSGARDTLSALANQYGLESSHSVSKVTMKQEVSVEVAARPIENVTTYTDLTSPQAVPTSHCGSGGVENP